MLDPGALLGPYEILDHIGAGGMGEVYRARDTRLGREVAVKVLPPRLGEDRIALGRFQREAKAVAALSHPNILAIHDVGSEGGIHFAVTELLEGETLRSRVRKTKLSWREAVEIAVQIADGMASAHERTVIHRDLKPENIFLTRDGRVKILDFGLAQTMESAPASPEEIAPTFVQTQPGTILGSVGYMAPEQLRGEPVDPTSDIFSFGCVLYEMVTGSRAFNRATAIETLSAILSSEPDDIAEKHPAIPDELATIIGRCLAKSRAERFDTMRDVAMNLRALLSRSSMELVAPIEIPKRAQPKKRSRAAIDTIAVLPFANASADPGAEYLSDGITDTIIHTLGGIPRLRVMASSTVFRYKGRNFDPLEVGRELGVRAVVTGRVVELGGRLVISTELVDVADGSRLWGEQYRRQLSDILELEAEIAGEICEKLRIRLSRTAKKKLSKRHTKDSEAYQLYLKARWQWSKRTVEGIRAGIRLCEEAIERDPMFALAWAAIADCWITLATNVPLRPADAMPRARAAARRALEIDSDLTEARVSLASVKWWYDWDRPGAEAELRIAIGGNHGYAPAHDVYSLVLTANGDHERALEEIRAARQLDPLSLIIGTHVALPLLFSGDTERAIAQLHGVLDLDPQFIPALGWLGLACEWKEMPEEAVRAYARALAVNDIALIRACMAHALARCGRASEADESLMRLEELAKSSYVSPYDFAVVHTGLGDVDAAIGWLEKAFADHAAWMVFLGVDRRLDPLRSDPRFEALLQRTSTPRDESGEVTLLED